jgi:hypothetical protein
MEHLACFMPATLALGAVTGADKARAERDMRVAKVSFGAVANSLCLMTRKATCRWRITPVKQCQCSGSVAPVLHQCCTSKK